MELRYPTGVHHAFHGAFSDHSCEGPHQSWGTAMGCTVLLVEICRSCLSGVETRLYSWSSFVWTVWPQALSCEQSESFNNIVGRKYFHSFGLFSNKRSRFLLLRYCSTLTPRIIDVSFHDDLDGAVHQYLIHISPTLKPSMSTLPFHRYDPFILLFKKYWNISDVTFYSSHFWELYGYFPFFGEITILIWKITS